MGYWRLIFFLSQIVINFIGLTTSQPDFLHYYCNNTGNYTSNSRYEANLNTLLASIVSNDTVRYMGSSVGQNSDRVEANVFCRGDAKFGDCRRCINNSAEKILRVCPNYKNAIGWYDYCTLQYSNRAIDIFQKAPSFFFGSTYNVSDWNEFNTALWTLLSSVNFEGVGSIYDSENYSYDDPRRHFRRESIDGPDNMVIYGTRQCTPHLSGPACSSCVNALTYEYIPSCCNKNTRGRIIAPSCTFSFDTAPGTGNGNGNGNVPYITANGTRNGTPLSVPTNGAGNGWVTITPVSSSRPPPLPSSRPPPLPPLSPSPGRKRRNVMFIIIGTSVSGVLTLTLVFCFHWMKRSKRRDQEQKKKAQLLDLAGERLADDYSLKDLHGEKKAKPQDCPLIRLDLIQAATRHFSEDHKLGQGGFGPVYKGTLANGKEIAVKRLSRTSGQGLLEFKNEITSIARLQHRNLVRLLGCCLERNESILIYEFMPNKSLDVFLFDSSKSVQLDWKKRFNIIKGIARGLVYLHEDSRLRIIHRDLKASNVLLDHEMNAKISDFGLARIFCGNQNEANTNRVVGTFGYMAPEYAFKGLFSVKSDVFSFGVLLLEIVSGKKIKDSPIPQSDESLLTFAWKLWCEGQWLELMDPLLAESVVQEEVQKCIHIGLLCVQEDPADRLTMSTVVVALEGDTIMLPTPTQPAFSLRRTVPKSIQPQRNDVVCSANEFTLSDISPR